MTNFTSTFTGKSTVQANFSLHDIPEHEISMMEVHGLQSSSDENWKDARVNYWVTSDLIRGQGQQSGYFVNVHPNGDRDCGTFEGSVSMNASGQGTIEGTWKYTHGTGQFSGLSGNGKFKGKLNSPTEVDMSVEGSYQFATGAGTRAA
jgi:hypothetical protein